MNYQQKIKDKKVENQERDSTLNTLLGMHNVNGQTVDITYKKYIYDQSKKPKLEKT